MDAARDLDAIGALRDPLRRRLYELARERDGLSRDEAAEATGAPRSTVAFHLDRLAGVGLLEVEHRRLGARTGPGAGRPAKIYRATPGELGVTLPPRRYDLMGQLFATAIERAAAGTSVRAVLHEVAADAGARDARDAGGLGELLDETGYRPEPAGDDVALTNCPFHRLAASHTDVVCEANHAYLCGAAAGCGLDPAEVVLRPRAGGCCVALTGAAAGAAKADG
jgi:predicted ArsR family transcriptional regulator